MQLIKQKSWKSKEITEDELHTLEKDIQKLRMTVLKTLTN